MDKGDHPCNICDKEQHDCFDCVWYSWSGNECNNYDCKYEYEGSCIFGFGEKCAMSTEYKGEEE